MKKGVGAALVCCFFLSTSVLPVFGQSTAAAQPVTPKEFPQWAKDLRRAEIVAFGSFPFSWFLTMLFTDLARSAAHNWDSQYWPWPAKPAGAVDMSTSEYGMTLSIAAGLSIVLALTDHFVVKNKRYYQQMRRAQNPQAEAVIERTPLFPREGAGKDADKG
ncbi:MAG: hypothetical protein LBC72_05640, partial [Spirochaetaceae bacterium]|nr:hypothetical protein [Spirochaetaceae bacterium]